MEAPGHSVLHEGNGVLHRRGLGGDVPGSERGGKAADRGGGKRDAEAIRHGQVDDRPHPEYQITALVSLLTNTPLDPLKEADLRQILLKQRLLVLVHATTTLHPSPQSSPQQSARTIINADEFPQRLDQRHAVYSLAIAITALKHQLGELAGTLILLTCLFHVSCSVCIHKSIVQTTHDAECRTDETAATRRQRCQHRLHITTAYSFHILTSHQYRVLTIAGIQAKTHDKIVVIRELHSAQVRDARRRQFEETIDGVGRVVNNVQVIIEHRESRNRRGHVLNPLDKKIE